MTSGWIKRYLPKEFFPIESEHAFLCRVLIACQRGRMFHLQESMNEKKEIDLSKIKDSIWLPSPNIENSANFISHKI